RMLVAILVEGDAQAAMTVQQGVEAAPQPFGVESALEGQDQLDEIRILPVGASAAVGRMEPDALLQWRERPSVFGVGMGSPEMGERFFRIEGCLNVFGGIRLGGALGDLADDRMQEHIARSEAEPGVARRVD